MKKYLLSFWVAPRSRLLSFTTGAKWFSSPPAPWWIYFLWLKYWCIFSYRRLQKNISIQLNIFPYTSQTQVTSIQFKNQIRVACLLSVPAPKVYAMVPLGGNDLCLLLYKINNHLTICTILCPVYFLNICKIIHILYIVVHYAFALLFIEFICLNIPKCNLSRAQGWLDGFQFQVKRYRQYFTLLWYLLHAWQLKCDTMIMKFRILFSVLTFYCNSNELTYP